VVFSVTTVLTVDSSVEDFDSFGFRSRFALLVGVPRQRVSVSVSAGSAVVTSSVETSDPQELNSISSTLGTLSKAQASAALLVDVQSIDVAARVEQVQPKGDAGDGGDAGVGGGGVDFPILPVAAGGAGLALVVLLALLACLIVHRRRRRARAARAAVPARVAPPSPVVHGRPANPAAPSKPDAGMPPAYLRAASREPPPPAGGAAGASRGWTFV
jgi:hypothetical protein